MSAGAEASGPEEPAALEPRAELAVLAGALARELRRRERRRPTRREEAPAAKPAASAAGEPAAAATPAQPPPSSEPVAAPAAPAPAPAPAAAPAAGPPAERPGAGAEPTLEERVAAVRARAEACSSLDELREAVAGCTACSLCRTRKQTVFADGDGTRPVLFVGEAPGFHEDQEGVPFVGRAGALLTDIITKGMGLERSEVLIANVLKCRPPENRDPTADEKRLCTPWLDRQIALADPRVIIPLGRHAAGHLLATDAPMGRMRGRVHERGGRRIVPTFHPAYLLRSPDRKRDCWQDIQLAMGELGLGPPERP